MHLAFGENRSVQIVSPICKKIPLRIVQSGEKTSANFVQNE